MPRQINKLLKYGIGEVLLVTIGILVALQINNWNDQRKSKKELKTILAIVKNDLASNIVECDFLIDRFTEESKSLDSLFATGSNQDSLNDCGRCYTANTGFADLVIKTRGLQMLQDFRSQNSVSSDSLIILINAFYTGILRYNTTMADLINKEVLENLKFYRDNADWYEQYITGELTDGIKSDIRTNTQYRNRIIHYRILVDSNYLKLLKTFKSQGQVIIDRLDQLE